MTTKPVIFLGSNTNIIQYVEVCELNNIPVAGIIDSDYFGNTENYKGIPVIGSELTADFASLKNTHNFFIGTNPVIDRNIVIRNNFIKLVNQHDLPCVNIIDPTARVSKTAKVGHGVYIGFCVSVSTDVKVGNHCQIHSHSIIGDCTDIKDNVIIQRRCTLHGSSIVESGAYLGINTVLVKRNKFSHITVGKNSKTFPSVTIMRDIKDYEVVTPNTAHRIYKHEKN